jgi:hypothetical protein
MGRLTHGKDNMRIGYSKLSFFNTALPHIASVHSHRTTLKKIQFTVSKTKERSKNISSTNFTFDEKLY